MSAKGEETPKRTTSLINERFSSNKQVPAPDPPKSEVGIESAKNTKIITTKHYTHHKHTRHVTEDEKIYETITTTSRPVSIAKTVYSTTQIEKNGPSKSYQRHYEKNVRLVNTEDNCNRTEPANDVEAKQEEAPKEPTPPVQEEPPPPPLRSVAKDPVLKASHESIYKTAANTISDLASLSNLSVKSLQNPVPPKLLEDNASVRSASASVQFNAEYERLGEIFTRWQELREELNNNSDSLQNMQDELIRQFYRVDQLRQLTGRKTPSVASLAVRQLEKMPSRVPTPVPSVHRPSIKEHSILLPSSVHKLPVKDEPILPADPNHNIAHGHLSNGSVRSKILAHHVNHLDNGSVRSAHSKVPVQQVNNHHNESVRSVHSKVPVQQVNPPDNVSVRSTHSKLPIQQTGHQNHQPDNVSVRSKASTLPKIPEHSKPPSIHLLSEHDNQQMQQPPIHDSTSADYIPIFDQWKSIYNGSLHHAQTLPNLRDNHGYESVKSFPLRNEPRTAVHTVNRAISKPASLYEEDVKSVKSNKLINDAVVPQRIHEEVKSEKSAKAPSKTPSMHEEVKSEKSVKVPSKTPSIHEDTRSEKSPKQYSKPASVHNEVQSKPPSVREVPSRPPSVHAPSEQSLKQHVESKPPSVREVPGRPPSVHAPSEQSLKQHVEPRPASVHNEYEKQGPKTHARNDDTQSVKSAKTDSRPPSLFQDSWLTKVASYGKLPSEKAHSEKSLKQHNEPKPIYEKPASLHHGDDNKSVKSAIYEQPSTHDDAKSTQSKKSHGSQTRPRASKFNPDEVIHPEPIYIDNASEHIYQAPNSVIGESHHYETIPEHDKPKHGAERPDYPPPPVAPPLPDFAQLKPPFPSRLPSIPVSAPYSEKRSANWDDVMRDIREIGQKRLSEEENTA